MKCQIILLAIIAVLLYSCKQKEETANKEPHQLSQKPTNKNILKTKFQSIIDSSEVNGSILIYDVKEDLYYSNDFEWANKGNLPASTFKIANSIIGLETGVIKSDSTIFKWDGEEKWSKQWEQDLVLKKAFQFSCVPCYQEVARKIGAKRMNEYVEKLAYGDLKIDSLNIDMFWLEGASQISQIQQIDFLKRFYSQELPISERTHNVMRDIMLFKETDQYKLSGKSGLSINDKKYNGWYVGYLEVQNNTYLFATNLEPKQEFEFDVFVKKRLNVTLKAFRELSILK